MLNGGDARVALSSASRRSQTARTAGDDARIVQGFSQPALEPVGSKTQVKWF